MNTSSKLGALLTQARVGTDAAARDRAFEEVLRLLSIFVRSSMGSALRRNRESVDICQTVARSFVADLRDGKLEFASEAALVAYLQTVVRTKLAEVARRDRAIKRGGPTEPGAPQPVRYDSATLPADDPTASVGVGAQEDLERAIAALTPTELELIRLRRTGMSWEQIAQATGRPSTALRKEWSRLQSRLREQPE